MTDTLLRAVLEELAVNIDDAYMLRRVNDQATDSYRDTIIGLFKRKNGVVKRGDVVNEVLSKSLKEIPGGIYTKIMKELATSQGANWTLKSGELDLD